MIEEKELFPIDAELKKHSAIIAMKHQINNIQRRMFNAILYLSAQILQSEPDTETFKIKMSDIRRLSGLTDFTNKKYLKNALSILSETSVEFNMLGKDKKDWLKFNLLAQVGIKHNSEYAEIEFPSAIRKSLYPEIYGRINLGILNNLTSKYSIPLYELLTDYKNIFRLRISIGILKNLLNVSPEKYKHFNLFREKVIDVAVTEINEKTDLEISYSLEKSGRSYSYIIFDIKSKDNKIETSTQILLKNYKISKSNIEKYSGVIPDSEILKSISVVEDSENIRNKTAYLTRLLENTYQSALKIDKTELIHSSQSVPEVETLDSEKFEKHIKRRTKLIMDKVTTSDISEFIAQQSEFSINYLIEKKVINEDRKLIDKTELINMGLFVVWLQNKYSDEDVKKVNYEQELF